MNIKARYNRILQQLCRNNRKTWEIKKEITGIIKQKNCVINGNTIPIAMMPVLLTDRELQKIANVTEQLGKIIDKTVKISFRSPRIKDYLISEMIPKEWMLDDTNVETTIKRVDFVYNNKDCKVIGAECDIARGQSWTDVVRQTFASHSFYQDLVTYPERENSSYLLSSLCNLIQKTHSNSPTVALVDFKDSECITDLQLACRFFTQQSIKAFIADPRDFKYQEGAYVNGARVDVVIRGCGIKELLKHTRDIGPFIEGYMNRKFLMINPLHCAYGSEKSILSLMKNTDFNDIYTKEDLSFITKHVPWTRRLSEENTHHGKNSVQLKEFSKAHKDSLVIKPSNQNPHMVQVGLSMEQARWDGVVNNYANRSDWVVQEYVNLPFIYQPKLVKGKIFKEKHFFSFSAFLLDNTFQMLLARCSPQHAINTTQGYVVPVFQYDPDKNFSSIRKYLC